MNRVSVFILEHPADTSLEVALTEALAIDRFAQSRGLEVVGGSYGQEGDARGMALRLVMDDE